MVAWKWQDWEFSNGCIANGAPHGWRPNPIDPDEPTTATYQILLGCGSRREKLLGHPDSREWVNRVTLDIEAAHKPDIVHDLNRLPLPFPDNSASEIHAYQVLEHCGRQGDAKFFFAQFQDFWRIMIPGGKFFASVPRHDSVWAWGDPSHTRVIPQESLIFLHQPSYAQVGKTSISDFRAIYSGDFDILARQNAGEHMIFVLEAVKPARHA